MIDENTEIRQPNLFCPRCGQPVPLDPPFWQMDGKFFCTQQCARGVKSA